MVTVQYELGISNNQVKGVFVSGMIPDEVAVLTCDLDRRITGTNLILGLSYKEDLEEFEGTPYEWFQLLNIDPLLRDSLIRGEEICLIEETTGEIHNLILSQDVQQEVAI